MPAYWLTSKLVFPPPEGADEHGLVAIGGDVRPERLLLAYSQGIFPWPHEGYPLLWFSPEPRFVLPLELAHVPRSLRKTIRRGAYEVRFDTRFETVMRNCAATPRPGQNGTWITEELVDGYTELHRRGFAHSIEAWRDGELVGGLYGVSLGAAFFGESMFAREPDASKVAFVTLLGHLASWGFRFVDAQVYTEHLERFGAVECSRRAYLGLLGQSLTSETRRGPWEATLSPPEALEALERYLEAFSVPNEPG